MRTTSNLLQTAASFLVILEVAIYPACAIPKGAELLLNPKRSSACGGPVSSSKAKTATNIEKIHTHIVKVITTNDDFLFIFEALIRDAADSIIGVDRITTDAVQANGLTVRTSLAAKEDVKETIKAAIKRFSQTGMIQGGPLTDSARNSFEAATVDVEGGELLVLISQAECKASAAPSSAAIKSADLSTTPFARAALANTHNGPHTQAQTSQDLVSVRSAPAQFSRNSKVPKGRVLIGVIVSLVAVTLGIIGMWTSARIILFWIKRLARSRQSSATVQGDPQWAGPTRL